MLRFSETFSLTFTLCMHNLCTKALAELILLEFGAELAVENMVIYLSTIL